MRLATSDTWGRHWPTAATIAIAASLITGSLVVAIGDGAPQEVLLASILPLAGGGLAYLLWWLARVVARFRSIRHFRMVERRCAAVVLDGLSLRTRIMTAAAENDEALLTAMLPQLRAWDTRMQSLRDTHGLRAGWDRSYSGLPFDHTWAAATQWVPYLDKSCSALSLGIILLQRDTLNHPGRP